MHENMSEMKKEIVNIISKELDINIDKIEGLIEIPKNNDIEVLDNTPEAELRLSAMEYIEERYKRERKRKQRKNPLWKLACFCGIV